MPIIRFRQPTAVLRGSADRSQTTNRPRASTAATIVLLVLARPISASDALQQCRDLRHGAPAQALPLCEQAAAAATAGAASNDAFEAWMHAAELASQAGDPDRAGRALDSATALLPRVHDPLAAHRLARRRGLNAYREQHPVEALSRFLEALAAARAADDKTALAISENDLGVTYRHLGNYAAALGHFQTSLQLREAGGEGDLGALMTNIGSLYLELGDLARAQSYLDRALADHEASGRGLPAHRTLEELARLARRQDRPDRSRAYLAQAWDHYVDIGALPDQLRLALIQAEIATLDGDREGVAPWLQRARRLSAQLDGTARLQIELLAAGQKHDHAGMEEAYRHLDAALAADQGAPPILVVRSHGRLAELAQSLGRLPSALEHLRQFQQREAALAEARHGERFDALRVSFDVARLETERERLAADSARQEAELSRWRLQTVLVAALALLALAGLTLYWQARLYRQRARAASERAALEQRVSDSRHAAEALRSDLRSMAWLLDEQATAALVFDAAGRIRAATRHAAAILDCDADSLQTSALARVLPEDMAQWAQALVESASLGGVPEQNVLGERSLATEAGHYSVRCRRLALEEELGVLLFEVEPAANHRDLPVATAKDDPDPDETEHTRLAFRQQLVALMQASLEAWERATRKTRIDLAEASGIWRITIDDGRLRVRAMDRYLGLDSLPERPRWREVLRTAYYLLAEVPLGDDQRAQLEKRVDAILQLTRRSD